MEKHCRRFRAQPPAAPPGRGLPEKPVSDDTSTGVVSTEQPPVLEVLLPPCPPLSGASGLVMSACPCGSSAALSDLQVQCWVSLFALLPAASAVAVKGDAFLSVGWQGRRGLSPSPSAILQLPGGRSQRPSALGARHLGMGNWGPGKGDVQQLLLTITLMGRVRCCSCRWLSLKEDSQPLSAWFLGTLVLEGGGSCLPKLALLCLWGTLPGLTQ